jgi:hypothetical protein
MKNFPGRTCTTGLGYVESIVRALETVIHHLYDSVKCIYSQFKCQQIYCFVCFSLCFPKFQTVLLKDVMNTLLET